VPVAQVGPHHNSGCVWSRVLWCCHAAWVQWQTPAVSHPTLYHRTYWHLYWYPKVPLNAPLIPTHPIPVVDGVPLPKDPNKYSAHCHHPYCFSHNHPCWCRHTLHQLSIAILIGKKFHGSTYGQGLLVPVWQPIVECWRRERRRKPNRMRWLVWKLQRVSLYCKLTGL